MSDVLDLLANAQEETASEIQPENPSSEIPSDWIKDRTTGEYRPRKRRGRKPAAVAPPSDHEPLTRNPDTEPDSKARGATRKNIPRYKAGVIAAGMTKFYRRTGRILKAMDRDIGIAVIESAEDCGEAWDDIARTNPRIRAFLMKMITGGSWAALFWAHAPIFMAIFMKDSIRRHIPFGKFFETVLESDEQTGGNEISDLLGGMTPDDMNQMVMAGMQMMNRMGFSSAASAPVTDTLEGES